MHRLGEPRLRIDQIPLQTLDVGPLLPPLDDELDRRRATVPGLSDRRLRGRRRRRETSPAAAARARRSCFNRLCVGGVLQYAIDAFDARERYITQGPTTRPSPPRMAPWDGYL